MTRHAIGTMTLADIRKQSPCKSGWKTLLDSLGGKPPMSTRVSLGDIARSNGAADAWWCVRALDWSDVATRRAVIATLLHSVRRAAKHTDDPRVHDCIASIQKWCDGDDTVDLKKAAEAEAAAWAAARAARADAAAWAAAAAEAAADAAAAALAHQNELDAQIADLTAAFPPLHDVKESNR